MLNRTTVTASALGAALGVIVVSVLGALDAVVSPELAAAITTLTTTVAGLLYTPE